jgi:hypothetical protein
MYPGGAVMGRYSGELTPCTGRLTSHDRVILHDHTPGALLEKIDMILSAF